MIGRFTFFPLKIIFFLAISTIYKVQPQDPRGFPLTEIFLTSHQEITKSNEQSNKTAIDNKVFLCLVRSKVIYWDCFRS